MESHDDDAPFAGEYLDFAEMERDELQAKLFELLTLVETSRELLRARDAEDVARRVLLSAIGVLGAGSACVLLRDGDHLVLGSQLGLDPEPRLRVRLSRSLLEAFREEPAPRPVRADEVLGGGAASLFLQQFADELTQLDADVVAPLSGREGLVGFLVLGRRLFAEGYTARDLELFASLAELYVLALERAPHLVPERVQGASSPGIARVRGRDEGDNTDLRQLRDEHPPLGRIVGESPAMLELFRDLVEFADSRATILIEGESGTGKELVAKAIHELSRRRGGPLEIVDCSSIPRELIESELFGHMRGAFTGAVRDRRGAFDLAHHGTIFLDEIGDMTLNSQTRLLRVLQEGKFRPVGGEKQHSVDVRVIAATNVDLRSAVREGRFRKDLFFRIQVFPVRLPPLREREGDVEVLTRAFLKRFFTDDEREPPEVDPEVFAELNRYPFPGNVRELQNMTEALAIRSRATGRVTLAALHDVFRSMNIHPGGRTALDVVDPELVEDDEPAPPAARTRGHDHVLPVRSVFPESPAGLDTGSQVVQAWRQASFNLLEASRRLRARKLEGEDVAVVDRAQMSHYLDGEILQAFLEEGGLTGAVERLAGSNLARHRAARRVRRVIERLALAAERGEPHRAFPRLPGEYRDAVRRLGDLGGAWIQRGLTEPAPTGPRD
jgi:transcriptional regulator with GAF, ATPase, and Fis domain